MYHLLCWCLIVVARIVVGVKRSVVRVARIVVRVARIVVGIGRYGVRVPGSRSIVRVSIAVIGRSLLTIPKLLSVDQSQTKANESNNLKEIYRIEKNHVHLWQYELWRFQIGGTKL